MYERIRACQKDKDLSQTTVAALLNVTQPTYSNYERGKVNIPIDILKKLAILHNTSIDYLLDLTDNPVPYERKQLIA